MRFFIVLFFLLSIISYSFGKDVFANRHSSRGARGSPGPAQDFAGSEVLSTSPEEMKKMQMLHPQFRLMN